MQRPLTRCVIGLTGGIGSGKSHARKFLEELGCLGIDADQLGHRAYAAGTAVNDRIVATFGPTVRAADGTINRAVLGKRVFADPTALQRLQELVWPAIGELLRDEVDRLVSDPPRPSYVRFPHQWAASLQQLGQLPPGGDLATSQEVLASELERGTQAATSPVEVTAPVIVIEAAVLFEAGWQQQMSEVWSTFVDRQRAIDRVVERNGLTAQEAARRFHAQLPLEDRLRRSDVAIDTSGPVSLTRATLCFKLARFVARHGLVHEESPSSRR